MDRDGLGGRLGQIEPTRFTGVTYRHVAVGQDPLSGRGARIFGGRWNPADAFSVVYAGLTHEVARAELERLARMQGREVQDLLPRLVFEIDVSLYRLLDLRDTGIREQLQVDASIFTARDRRACQTVGLAAHDLGLEGLLAPSATGTGDVLALFIEQLDQGSSCAVRPNPTTWN